MPHDPAFVRPVDAVIDRDLAVAANAAPAKLRVERLEQLRIDLAEQDVAKRGFDMEPRVGLVALTRVLLGLVHCEPRVDGRVERRLGARGGARRAR
jgi:hypothetical protein